MTLEQTLRQSVIPFHLVVMRVNIVDPVIPYTLSNVCNVQIPVGVDHNTFGGFGGRLDNPPGKTNQPAFILPATTLQDVGDRTFVVVAFQLVPTLVTFVNL